MAKYSIIGKIFFSTKSQYIHKFLAIEVLIFSNPINILQLQIFYFLEIDDILNILKIEDILNILKIEDSKNCDFDL